jgi:hypothetical protein
MADFDYYILFSEKVTVTTEANPVHLSALSRYAKSLVRNHG